MIFILLFSVAVWSAEISESTLQHFGLLNRKSYAIGSELLELERRLEGEVGDADRKTIQEALASKRVSYERINDEISRMQKEYGSALPSYSKSPKDMVAELRRKAAERRARQHERTVSNHKEHAAAAREMRARQHERTVNNHKKQAEARANARREAAARRANADWHKRREDFLSVAEEELQQRPRPDGTSFGFYANEEAWRKAYESEMSFAEGRVSAGGLGFDPKEADVWVRQRLKSTSSAEIVAHRSRYAKAAFYLQTPAAKGGPGYVRGYVRKIALDLADKTDSELDKWIAQDKARRASARSSSGFARFKQSCEGWFRAFGS